MGTQFQCFGGNNTSGEIDTATALNAHGGAGRMDFESETFVAGPLMANAHPGSYSGQDAEQGLLIAHSLSAEGFDASEDGTGRGTPLVPVSVSLRGRDGGGTAELGGEISNALRASGGGGDKAHVLTAAVRRLTPTECERLQGFPDGYTQIPRGRKHKPTADGPRYKALGNSWAVPCVRWIFERMDAVNKLVRE